MVQQFQNQAQNNQGMVNQPKRIFDMRVFDRMEKFDGKIEKYRDWLFDLKVAIGNCDRKCAQAILRIEAKKESDLANALTKLYPVLVEFKKVQVASFPSAAQGANSSSEISQQQGLLKDKGSVSQAEEV